MFEPFRCEDCIHGEYNEQEGDWDCNIGCWSGKSVKIIMWTMKELNIYGNS